VGESCARIAYGRNHNPKTRPGCIERTQPPLLHLSRNARILAQHPSKPLHSFSLGTHLASSPTSLLCSASPATHSAAIDRLPARLGSPPRYRGECSGTHANGDTAGGPQWTGRRKGSDGRRGGWGELKSCMGV
jgi:hypothetical protein